ncbi:MAG: hypothetical protein ACP5JK_00720 [Candidatus Aenigmatarchaeota archaeon]
MRKRSLKLFIIYSKILAYFIFLTLLLCFSTIILHELGHFFFGLYAGCYGERIVLFDINIFTTYTEMQCPPNTNIFLLGLSGFFVVIPFSLIIILFLKGPERYFGLIMIGFNFVIATWDFETYLNFHYSEAIATIGILITILGEILLIQKSIE